MKAYYKEGKHTHPNKRSMIMSVLIAVLIFNVMLQIWLLYTTLNNALAEHTDIAIPAFIASFAIFLVGALWLYFLPRKHE